MTKKLAPSMENFNLIKSIKHSKNWLDFHVNSHFDAKISLNL